MTKPNLMNLGIGGKTLGTYGGDEIPNVKMTIWIWCINDTFTKRYLQQWLELMSLKVACIGLSFIGQISTKVGITFLKNEVILEFFIG
jgi:hypothetical protein